MARERKESHGIRCRKSRLKLTPVLLNAPKREVPAKIARPVVTIQRRSSLSANRPIRGENITPISPNEAVANPAQDNDAGYCEISLTEQTQVYDRPLFSKFPGHEEAEPDEGDQKVTNNERRLEPFL